MRIIGEHLEASDSWELLQPLPQERVSFDTVYVGGDKLAFVGGQYKGVATTVGNTHITHAAGYTDEVTVWNMRARRRWHVTSTRRWSTYYLDVPRRRPASVAWGPDRLVVCGGYSRGLDLKSCEVVDIIGTSSRSSSDDSIVLPDMTHTRDSGRAVLYRDRFMIVMGGEGDHEGNTVEVLDLSRIGKDDDNPAVWTALPPMTKARDYFSAIIVEDTLVVAGGEEMEILDLSVLFNDDGVIPNNGNPAEFQTVATLPIPMAFMGMVAIPVPLKNEEGNSNVAVTLFLANGNKENEVLAYNIPSFSDFIAEPPQDIEEGSSRDKTVGTWYELPSLKVPAWRVDLVLVGDSLLGVGDTWIERLVLSSAKGADKPAIFESLDYRVPKNWICSLLYRPQRGTRVSSIVFGADGMHYDDGSDPRLRNAILSICLVWFIFFRHWRPQFGGGNREQPLGRN